MAPEQHNVSIIRATNTPHQFSYENGILLTDVEPGRARGELTVGPNSINPHGNVHGGALTTLADTVAGANSLVVMLMLGIMFEVRLDGESRHQVVSMVAGRVAVQFLMALLLFFFLPFPAEQRVIAALVVCAPISGMATVFCGKLDCDPSVYGTATSITIPISVAVMMGLSLL